MYGIINKAIEDMVKENFGSDAWNAILERSGVEEDFFISSEPYDDEITYRLAGAASEVAGLPLSDVLSAFGEWWILRTSKEKYGNLLDSGGASFREFMINLPVFHNRVMLIYPKLTPPEFRVSNLEENSLHVHYLSQRAGLKDFVYGLLLGLGKMYQTKVLVEVLESRDQGSDHEVYKVSW